MLMRLIARTYYGRISDMLTLASDNQCLIPAFLKLFLSVEPFYRMKHFAEPQSCF